MCFVVHKDYEEERIAKEDIMVIKALSYSNRGPYYGSVPYKQGIVRQNVKLDVHWNEIEEGYHSYSEHVTLTRTRTHLTKFVVDKLKNRPAIRPYLANADKICLFIIPEGARYYYNPDRKEYVSSTIVYIGDI